MFGPLGAHLFSSAPVIAPRVSFISLETFELPRFTMSRWTWQLASFDDALLGLGSAIPWLNGLLVISRELLARSYFKVAVLGGVVPLNLEKE